jgi:hypothetical protein
MMLRLTMDRRPRWLVLEYGVKVEVRPLSTSINEAAIAEARRRAAVFSAEADVAEKAGQPLDALGANGANAAWLEGQRQQFYAEALARYAILRWEGVADDGGNPLPVTPAAIEAFAAHPDLSLSFVAAYSRSLREVAVEGNGSALFSDGASEAETTPAAAATEGGDTPASLPASDLEASAPTALKK